MPLPLSSYETVGRRAGGHVGAAAGAGGGGLLSTLGSILEPLDYVRQAAWNVPRSLARTAETGDLSELGGLLPALGGVAGFMAGGPIGAALGAGVTQGLGRQSDRITGRKTFDAPTGEDALRFLGDDPEAEGGTIKSMLLQAVGDPLTFLGGGAGAARGAAKGGAFGADLANKARWVGPKFQGEDAIRAAIGKGVNEWSDFGSPRHLEAMKQLQESPLLKTLAGEVPPGSTYLGSGVESLAMKTPDGGVVLLRRNDPDMGLSAPGGVPGPRPVSDNVVPAIRSKPFPHEAGGYRVEHTPFSPDVSQSPFHFNDPGITRDQMLRKNREYDDLKRSIRMAGEEPFDLHRMNIGWGPEGKMLMRDPGASDPLVAGTGMPRPEMLTPGEPSPLQKALMGIMNSKQAVRNEMAAAMPAPYQVPDWARVPEPSPVERLKRALGMTPPTPDDLASPTSAQIAEELGISTPRPSTTVPASPASLAPSSWVRNPDARAAIARLFEVAREMQGQRL